jgi:hypothetical protein
MVHGELTVPGTTSSCCNFLIDGSNVVSGRKESISDWLALWMYGENLDDYFYAILVLEKPEHLVAIRDNRRQM